MYNISIFRLSFLFCFLFLISIKSYGITIEDSISKGLNNSKALAAISLEWASLQEKVNQSFAGKEITGTLTGSLSETYSGYSGDYNNSFSNSITATLSKKLYDGGISKSNEKINNIKINQKSIQIKVLEQQVILKIINSHLNVFLSQKIKELRQKNFLRVKEQVEANKARLLAGAINKTVLAESEARLARANSQLIESSLDLTNNIEQYLSLIGASPDKLIIPSEIKTLPENEVDALERAEKFSLNIALARLNVSLNNAQYNSLISSVMPTVTSSLSGSISDSTRNGNVEGLTLSLSLKSPIFYTPATSSKNREIVALAKALNFNLDETRNLNKLNVKLKLNNVSSKKSIIDAVIKELNAAKIASEATLNENQFGAKTILDVLDAEINVLNAEISLWRAKSDFVRSSYELLAEMGELHTESLGLTPSAPQYNIIELIAPPLPSPFSLINPNKWIE